MKEYQHAVITETYFAVFLGEYSSDNFFEAVLYSKSFSLFSANSFNQWITFSTSPGLKQCLQLK